jgi:hypothetical protein
MAKKGPDNRARTAAEVQAETKGIAQSLGASAPTSDAEATLAKLEQACGLVPMGMTSADRAARLARLKQVTGL